IRVLCEVAVLGPHDAETLARRRLHDDPALYALQALRTQRLEALHFGLDIVGLDVEVHAALVVHRLHLDVHALIRHLQFHVLVAFLARQDLGGKAKRTGPEMRRRLEVVRAAVDDESREPALVHDYLASVGSIFISMYTSPRA